MNQDSRVIFKYDLHLLQNGTWMPVGAEILSIQVQNETEIKIWALVDPS